MAVFKASEIVCSELRADILVVEISGDAECDQSAELRRGLLRVIAHAEANDAVRAVLLCCRDVRLIEGASIRDLRGPSQAPSLGDICNRIEGCGKLVVAHLDGVTVGGGFEIALASHYRIASDHAGMGLPEVKYGAPPAAGGTQRIPRLIGAQSALDVMLTGRVVNAAEAHALGLVDKIGVSGDSVSESIAYVHLLLHTHAPRRRTRNADSLNFRPAAVAAINAARVEAKDCTQHLSAVSTMIIDCVQAALDLPFDEGLGFERRRLLECLELSKPHAPECVRVSNVI